MWFVIIQPWMLLNFIIRITQHFDKSVTSHYLYFIFLQTSEYVTLVYICFNINISFQNGITFLLPNFEFKISSFFMYSSIPYNSRFTLLPEYVRKFHYVWLLPGDCISLQTKPFPKFHNRRIKVRTVAAKSSVNHLYLCLWKLDIFLRYFTFSIQPAISLTFVFPLPCINEKEYLKKSINLPLWAPVLSTVGHLTDSVILPTHLLPACSHGPAFAHIINIYLHNKMSNHLLLR